MLRAEGKQENDVFRYLHDAHASAAALAQAAGIGGPVEIFGVVPAAMPRRANHIRAQLLIQSSNRKVLQQFLRNWQPALDAMGTHKLHCSLDVDPLDF